jgi:site-specific recombinase XerD
MSRNYRSTLAYPALLDAYTDFILSRQSKGSRKTTLDFYFFTACKFLEWAETVHNIEKPEDITARTVREYLAELVQKGRKDSTVWDNARAIRTMLKFWHASGYMQVDIKFDMPKIAKKRLPRLNAEQLQEVLKACSVRDKALLMFMADSGVRREEAIKLNWEDVDMQTGYVLIKEGKGGKARVTVIGAKTRRALLAYRRTLANRNGVLFQTDEGTRFTGSGMLAIFRRLRKRTGIHVTPHAMRRTFTILSLRAEMDSLHLQHLGGWESIDMVDHYAQMEDIDLLRAHKAHSPVDNLDKLKS